MILLKVIHDSHGVHCIYKCSQCGEEFDGSCRLPTFCMTCGRKLDKAGKPGTFFGQGNTIELAVQLAFVAIKNGILKEPLPKVEKRGTGFDQTYICAGEPADKPNESEVEDA